MHHFIKKLNRIWLTHDLIKNNEEYSGSHICTICGTMANNVFLKTIGIIDDFRVSDTEEKYMQKMLIDRMKEYKSIPYSTMLITCEQHSIEDILE